jgi:hypothetical protein
MVHREQYVVAGLIVNVFSTYPLAQSSRPVIALFFLHGRRGSAAKIEGFVDTILEKAQGRGTSPVKYDLIVITFVGSFHLAIFPLLICDHLQDHRNHGTRVGDKKANDGWSKKPELNNERHA